METKDLIRTNILDAALSEFGTYGYKLASTNRIYPLAKVSKGAIFKHFHSKADLYYAVYQRAINDMLEQMNAIDFDVHDDIFAKIVEIIMWKIEYSQKHPLETKVMLEAIGHPLKAIETKILNHLKDLTKLSIRYFFEDIPMENIREEFSKADVIQYLEVAVAGIQAYYINQNITLEYMESIRADTIRFLKTVLRGMEKEHGKRI